jgi:hypothetical protein
MPYYTRDSGVFGGTGDGASTKQKFSSPAQEFVYLFIYLFLNFFIIHM